MGKDYLAACAEGAVAGSLLIIAIEVLVSAGFEVPGSLGLINPTAVLGEGLIAAVIYIFCCVHPARQVSWDYVPGTQRVGCYPS